MTQFNAKIPAEFLQDEPLPPVVTEKWAEAARQIAAGEIPQKKGAAHKIRSICLKSGGSVAAAITLLFTVAFINPVFAENIPLVRDIVDYFKNHDTKTYLPAEVTAPEIQENMKPVAPVKKETALSVEQAYCDGDLLVFSTVLAPSAETAPYDTLGVKSRLTVNGADLTENMRTYGLQKLEDGSMAGLTAVDVSGLGLTSGSLDLTLSIDQNAKHVDRKTLILFNYEGLVETFGSEEALVEAISNMSVRERRQSLSWQEKTEDVTLSAGLSFSGTVAVDSSKLKVYDVNKEENGCAVHTLTVSPTSTRIDLNMPEDTIYTLTDSAGNEINRLKLGKEDLDIYEPLFEETTAVTVRFYSMSDRTNPMAQFEIPVEGGYARQSGRGDAWATPVDENEITFIPPLPPLPADWLNREAEDTVVQLGETVTLSNASDASPAARQALTVSNMQVFDNPEAAGIDASLLRSSALDGSGCRFVTLDLHIKNLDGPGDGVSIGAYGQPQPKNPGLLHNPNCDSDLAYFSGAGQGIKDYYYADDAFDTEYSCTVGFYWDEADLKEGNLQWTIVTYTEDGTPEYTHIELPPYVG